MSRPFLFNVVFWGEYHTKQLIDYTIPTLLSPNNIPSLVKVRDCEFLFVTTPQDAELLRGSESFKLLSSLMPIQFCYVLFDNIDGSKYNKMTLGHTLVCQYGKDHKAYGIFLMPEMLIADGTLLYFDESVNNGSQAIVIMVLRLIEEELTYLRGPPIINISKRDLVYILFRCAHPEIRSFMMDNDTISLSPGFLIWPDEEQPVWIIHGIRGLPVLVDLENAVPEALGLTLDTGNFVGASIADKNTIDVVTDSDQALICSITPRDDVPTSLHLMTPTVENITILFMGQNI